MKSSVSVRLGLVFGAIIFFTVAISYFYLGGQLRKLFYDGLKNELYKQLELNRQLFDTIPADWSDIGSSDQWADNVGAALEVRVTLISLKGEVIGDSYISPDRLRFVENHLNRPEVQGALTSGFGESTRFSETIGENMLYLAVPLGKEKPYSVLRFAKPLHEIRRLEAELRKGIEGALFWSLLLSLLFGSLTAFLLSSPLRNIASAAEHFIHGDFSARLTIKRNDEIGQLARAFNFMSDEMKRMNQQKEWFKAVFSSIREAIIVTDPKGRLMLANPAACRLFGIERMDNNRAVQGRKVTSAQLQYLFERVGNAPGPVVKEEMQIMTEKGERVLKVSAVPVLKDNYSEGTVYVLNDITRLRNLERIRRDFVSSVSHELRTPLTSIRGYTETLLEGAIDDRENARHFLSIIHKESEQLTALINDVLDLSRIESGKIEYRFGPVSLSDVVDTTLKLFSRSLESKGIRPDVRIPEHLVPVYADRHYLELVIRNLVDNAIKYVADENGRIRLTAYRDGQKVKLEVEDNGAGIPQKDLDRVFERFYRVDKARSRQIGGTGLGLSIVKHIVLAHNGTIEVRSRLNLGSVFTVTLLAYNEQKESVKV
ncbi:MAG TPA: HAMP domain-containing protein [Prosthecochloris aestuarii]|uniref:histidine kinase n=1 Tax=Prosthecochloris aestuarii TaxID=1102 RepID=A0A831STV6_PROAE|nr:HAMP domain-containing protein [Prosthecochloris aestuarii]